MQNDFVHNWGVLINFKELQLVVFRYDNSTVVTPQKKNSSFILKYLWIKQHDFWNFHEDTSTKKC